MVNKTSEARSVRKLTLMEKERKNVTVRKHKVLVSYRKATKPGQSMQRYACG